MDVSKKVKISLHEYGAKCVYSLLVAHFTSVRLLAGVLTPMNTQRARTGKATIASIARVRPFARMRSHVQHHIRGLYKRFAALGANVRSIPGVRSLVRRQR